jgi:hypothetical protein
MSPQVVFSVAVTVAPGAKETLGAALYCAVPGAPGAGVAHVAALMPVSDDGTGSALADEDGATDVDVEVDVEVDVLTDVEGVEDDVPAADVLGLLCQFR